MRHVLQLDAYLSEEILTAKSSIDYGPGRYLTFEGFSVDHKGKQHYLDATVAYRETTLRCIEYLKRFGG